MKNILLENPGESLLEQEVALEQDVDEFVDVLHLLAEAPHRVGELRKHAVPQGGYEALRPARRSWTSTAVVRSR